MVSATDRKAGARVISATATVCDCPCGLLVVDLRPGAGDAWALAGLSVFAVDVAEEVEGPAMGEGETVRS
jgi:hypothetical protein